MEKLCLNPALLEKAPAFRSCDAKAILFNKPHLPTGKKKCLIYNGLCESCRVTTNALLAAFSLNCLAVSLSPVPVQTLEDLRRLGEPGNLNGVFRLKNDIDLSSEVTGWVPVGNHLSPFTGSFYGNNYSIINLKANNTGLTGLFGKLVNATVSDLRMINATCYGTGSTGSLAGQSWGSTITNIQIIGGSVTAQGYGAHAGAIVGRAEQGTVIQHVKSNSQLQTYRRFSYAGAAAGYSKRAKINDVENTGPITTFGEPGYAGGGVGRAYGSAISNVLNSGNILTDSWGGSAAGGIGCARNCQVSNIFNLGNIMTLGRSSYPSGGVGHAMSTSVKGVVNTGEISSRGIFSPAGPGIGRARSNSTLENAINTGVIKTEGRLANVGGSVGRLQDSTTAYTLNTARLVALNPTARVRGNIGTGNFSQARDGFWDHLASGVTGGQKTTTLVNPTDQNFRNSIYRNWNSSAWRFGNEYQYPFPRALDLLLLKAIFSGYQPLNCSQFACPETYKRVRLVNAENEVTGSVHVRLRSDDQSGYYLLEASFSAVNAEAGRSALFRLFELPQQEGDTDSVFAARLPLHRVWNYPFSQDYFIIVQVKQPCPDLPFCLDKLILSGRSFSSQTCSHEAVAGDYFLSSGLQESAPTQAQPEVSKERVDSCAEMAMRITEGRFTGTLTYQPGSDTSIQESAPPMNIVNIQCLRDEQGNMHMFADAEIPVQRPIKAMLTTYYQPGDEQLTWYGLEVGFNDDECSGNSMAPALVPSTSIVLRQQLSP